MADVRKSATQTAARKRAREKAAAFREKQDTLEQLAADYFIATDEAIRIRNAGQEELRALQARIDKDAAAVVTGAEKVICDMLELGASTSEVAERLGIANRHIRQAITNHRTSKKTTPDAASEDARTDPVA